MKNLQEQALWHLAPGEALSLPIGPGVRELRVSEGRLWLTSQGSAAAPAQDVWLQAGDSLRLPSGSQVVLEAWPQAAFQLLVPPCVEPSARRAAPRAEDPGAQARSSGLRPALA